VKTYEVQNDTSKTEKHTPYIEIPSEVKPNEPFQVTVQVGKDIPHPNLVEHHIKWIQVFFEEEDELLTPFTLPPLTSALPMPSQRSLSL